MTDLAPYITQFVATIKNDLYYKVFADAAPKDYHCPFVVYSVDDWNTEYGLEGPYAENITFGVTLVDNTSEGIFNLLSRVKSKLETSGIPYECSNGDKSIDAETRLYVLDATFTVTFYR